ncbi:MAG TPA: CCA tRNA nucleotidyltransferase, partial [Alphaproteobacteria bacterium]|nr:CCA tRNA nucleotidyltransferase [Alphaproteobacteria bacterium]
VVDGRPFEITTLRHDVVTYGRHADFAFTDDWKADAARRDFTINAMSATLDGDVYDYFSGMEDLRNGHIIFVGDAEKRVQEDILRILRFFRFHAHFGKGEPHTAALAACAKFADHLPRLSAERIRNETLKLLEAQNCPAVWQLMLQNRIVTHFLPEATNVTALERLVRLEEKYHSPGYVLRRLLSVLDVTVEGLMKVIESLRLSKEQGGHLLTLFEPGVAVDNKMDEATVNRAVYQLGNDVVRSLLLLCAARDGKDHNLAQTFQWATAFRPPRFPLQAQDVLDMGYAQGPDIGRILGNMESWWLAEDFAPGRTACLRKLQDDYAKL